MDRLVILSFFSFILLSCININSQDSKKIQNFNPEQFQSSFEKNPGIILDVRTDQEIKSGIIENASMVDFYDVDFKKKISRIDKSKTVYVYCRSGGRSSKAAKLLIEQGQFRVINLKGGIMAWKREGYKLSNNNVIIDSNNQKFSLVEFENLISKEHMVLVDFHTMWCAPCKKMIPIIDDLEKEYSEDVYILRIDLDYSEILANQFKINSIPTLILFKKEKEIWRGTGFKSREEIVAILENNL